MDRKSVFIIDDEAALAHIYCDVLREEGMDARHASNGREALSCLSSMPPPDLILLDFNMPAMNGSEFLTQLRRHRPEVLSRSKIVGFSSYAADVPWLDGFRASVSQIVGKPHDIDGLIEMVKALVA